jgi:hypothetical protein
MKAFLLTGVFLAALAFMLVIDPILTIFSLNWLSRIVGWGWQIPYSWQTVLIGIILFLEFRGLSFKSLKRDEQVSE